MMTSLIVQTASGVFIDDWSTFVRSGVVHTGEHGFESLEAALRIPFYDAFNYYLNYGALRVIATFGPMRIFEGRLNDATQFIHGASGGLKIVALGHWVALSDVPHTALWSISGVRDWRQMNELDITNRTPAKYQANNSNQLYLTTQKGIIFNNGADVGSWLYQIPDGSSRQIVGASFDYTINLPLNWVFQYIRHQAGFTGSAGTTAVTGSGAQVSGSLNVTFSGCDYIEFAIFNNTGANSTPAGETGANFIRLTNIRLVSSTANRISTTLGTAIAAGTRTVTPASMANIYVGQRLQIGGTISESVIVTAITSTTFTAVFAQAHLAADTVQAHVIYPDEIIKDCVTTVNAVNSTQISASLGMIQSQGVDQVDAIFEDSLPSDAINTLVKSAGDNQTIPRVWTALIYENRQLIVRPRGSGRTWYIDIDSLDIQRSLTQLANRVVILYTDASGRKQRSTASDATSIARVGITRGKIVRGNVSNSVQANLMRDTILASTKEPIPRVNVPISAIYDSSGAWHDPRELRADDTITIRNFPPIVGLVYDKIRTLVVTRVSYDLVSGQLKDVELELPQPNLDVQVARLTKQLA